MASKSPSDSNEIATRLRDIRTRWSRLQAPEALDYLSRTYYAAILSYVRGRLGRGDFAPLRADDAEDVLQDFFVRLGSTEWLSKPDPERGHFRPYLVRGLDYFLRERRAVASGKLLPRSGDEADAVIEQVAQPDPLVAVFEQEWKAATVQECIRRIRGRNEAWGTALDADLCRDKETDADIAARLGCSVDTLRSVLKRARKAFRDLYRYEESRLDGLGGEGFAEPK